MFCPTPDIVVPYRDMMSGCCVCMCCILDTPKKISVFWRGICKDSKFIIFCVTFPTLVLKKVSPPNNAILS